MFRTCKILGVAVILGISGSGRLLAEVAPGSPAGLFANAHDVFPSLIADPRELQFALRLVMPVSHTAKGEVAAGDYFGLYRWVLPWQDAYVQWSIGGGEAARFDLVSIRKDEQVNDYNASMPLDLRVGKWSARLLPYHISSHLGDDYIKETGILPQKYSFDSFKLFVAYEPTSAIRLYGGYHYVIRNEFIDKGPHVVQGGTEWHSGWWGSGHAETYWANDVQCWERVGWNPSVNSQLGVRIVRSPEQRQSVSPYVEFSSGHMTWGQFYQQKETSWVLGLHFELP